MPSKAVDNSGSQRRCQTAVITLRNHRRMRLQYAAMGAMRAQRAREQMRRRGKTPNGHLLWEPWEDAIVRTHYPDYRAMRRALRRRSYYALLSRARVLGVTRKVHVWLCAEESRLRRLYPQAERSEVLRAFPGMTWGQIRSKAKHMRLRRPRRKLRETGHPMVDIVIARALAENLSKTDMDFLARSKKFFRQAHRRVNIDGNALLRAIDVLGGELSIRWR